MAQAVKEKKEAVMGSPEMTRIMMEAAAPGEQHKALAKMVGSWSMQIKSWADPSQPPRESKGTSDQKMILGGRFLAEAISGEMMGTKYEGYSIIGYDNHAEKFASTYIDTTSTGIIYMEGCSSKDGRIVTMEGNADNPVLGQMKLRSVTSVKDDNEYTFELFSTTKNGKEMKMMEITYKRS